MVAALVSFLLWINIIVITAMDISEICQLPPYMGDCKYSLNKWFYNSTSNQCETFIYSGCNGNANRFPNKMECEKNCIEIVTKEHSFNKTEVPVAVTVYECAVPKDSGKKCNGSNEGSHQETYRWYWSEENFACLSFKYNGCGGNSNNFETKEACMDFCQPRKENDNICIKRDIFYSFFLISEDGPACLGGQSVRPIVARSRGPMIVCPKGSVYAMGPFFAECCNETIESE